MTEHEIKSYENLILRKMRRLLAHLPGHSKEVLDIESGREYICMACDLPLKPCAIHPGSVCCLALKGGTELFELEAALIRLQSGEYGTCTRCGRPTGKQFLKVHPESVLCERCLNTRGRVMSKSVPVRHARESRRT